MQHHPDAGSHWLEGHARGRIHVAILGFTGMRRLPEITLWLFLLATTKLHDIQERRDIDVNLKHALAMLGLIGLSASAQAQDPNLARNLAATCANCHGTNGHSLGGMESLAGEAKDKLMQKLMDYKSGEKPATIMHQIVKGYSDTQLELITAWYAAQK